MATSTGHVPKLDWEKHKATILELYCERGLPLTRKVGSRETHQCVDWTMRQHHGFEASQWQYENQLKKWRVAKNLKQGEWISLLAEYDRLETHGHEVRIVISGQVQTKERIRKARHRYCKPSTRTAHPNAQGKTSTPSRQAFVEIKEDGSWRRCTQYDLSVPSNTLVPRLESPHPVEENQPTTVTSNSANISSLQRRGPPPGAMSVSQTLLSTTFPEIYPISGNNSFHQPFPSSPFSLSPLDLDFGFLETGSGPISPSGAGLAFSDPSGSPWGFPSDLITSDDLQPNSTRHGVRNSQLSCKSIRSVARSSPGLEQFLTFAPHGDSVDTAVHESAHQGVINYATDRYQSLVAAGPFFSQERSSSQAVASVFGFDKDSSTMLYSMINGLAGLDDSSCGSILQTLGGHNELSQRLMNILKNGPDTVTKQLADNLFRAAIISGDSKMAALLLQTTQARPNIAIDLNGCIQSSDGMKTTALSIVLWLGNEEIVEILLNAGADPNRNNLDSFLMPALQTAVLQRKTDIAERLRIINLLIKYGAAITRDVMDTALHGNPMESPVIMALIESIPARNHMFIFQSHDESTMYLPGTGLVRSIADRIVCYIENPNATFGVKRLVDACRSTGCGKCVSDNDAMNGILAHASRRGNLELTELIIQYATLPSNALAGAVRSGKLQLIHFLLERGARADGPPVDFNDRVQLSIKDSYTTFKTTPLAEAIALQDPEFVAILQEYGAWTPISRRDHLEPAIIAAAKVGNTHYLDIILQRTNSPIKYVPDTAIILALERDDFEMVLRLLRTGVSERTWFVRGHLLLRLGLQKRNKQVVDALLDSSHANESMEYHSEIDPGRPVCLGFAMELACSWGEMGIVSDLSGMGFPLDVGYYLTPLGAAVDSGNKILVEHLLKLGVDPGTKAYSGWTPLAAAVRNRDLVMMDHLLSKGATPADAKAFVVCLTCQNMTAASKLRSAFLEKHPLGLGKFGGDLMIQAIYTDNQLLIDFLLDMKVDLNSLTDWADFRDTDGSGLGFTGDEEDGGIVGESCQRPMSPLEFAIIHGKCNNLQLINKLLSSGARADAIIIDGKSRAARVKGKWRSEDHIWHFRTPLLLAVSIGSKILVEILLDHGADINRPARRGITHTPLQLACELGSYDMVQFLLQKGADINSPPAKRYGGTAFQFATKSGSMKITELLLENSADPHAHEPEFGGGNTAFGWAAEMGRYHILLLLWRMAPRDGFTTDVLQKARDLARENGHRGCVDIITFMLQDPSYERLISLDAEHD